VRDYCSKFIKIKERHWERNKNYYFNRSADRMVKHLKELIPDAVVDFTNMKVSIIFSNDADEAYFILRES